MAKKGGSVQIYLDEDLKAFWASLPKDEKSKTFQEILRNGKRFKDWIKSREVKE